MDRFLVPDTHPADPSQPLLPAKRLAPRQIWNHGIYEVEGRISSCLKQAVLNAMLRSYSEIGKFSQLDPTLQMEAFSSHGFVQGGFNTFLRSSDSSGWVPGVALSKQRNYLSCLDFDIKGVYLASTSNNGWLVVHEYESLYCHAKDMNNEKVMPLLHISTGQKLEAVCWNPGNQDEIACVASWGSKVYCYDIACISCKPAEVLKVKSSSSRDIKIESTGLFDLTFCKLNPNRVLACGRDGNVHVWDRRTSAMSQFVLCGPQSGAYLNSLQLTVDEQVVYAGTELGQIHAWDLRGGRNSIAFSIPGEVYNPPIASLKVAKLLEQISSLRAQTDIEVSGIQSLKLNPYCGNQLAFHLNNGWSGVVDLSTFEITHVHCPPPPWLDGTLASKNSIRQRKAAWLPTCSTYASGSSSDSKIYLLDFTLGPKSLCFAEENRNRESKSTIEIPVSEAVVACAAHPMNENLVVGTEGCSLLLVGPKRNCVHDDDVSPCHLNLSITESS